MIAHGRYLFLMKNDLEGQSMSPELPLFDISGLYSILSQEIGCEERLRNDLFCFFISFI